MIVRANGGQLQFQPGDLVAIPPWYYCINPDGEFRPFPCGIGGGLIHSMSQTSQGRGFHLGLFCYRKDYFLSFSRSKISRIFSSIALLLAATFSGVPCTTIRPPRSLPQGPDR